jgi:RND family efflux transporter MFP subunit
MTHRDPSERPRRTARLTAAAILALLAACPWPLAASPADPAPALATAEPAERSITLSGFTRPRAEVPLVAETSGRVVEVYADIGDRVGPDGGFARIDDTFIRLDRDENEVQQERLRAQIEYDEREVQRYQELARQSNASASQLDALQQALRNNGHELRALEVRERILDERLARTRVGTPEGWRITARMVEPGQWVREGETLGQAADFSTLLVPFALTPEQFEALESQSEDLSLLLPDRAISLPAQVHRTNPGFDPQTRKIAVELAFSEPVEHARGGLRAELDLRLPERSGAVSVPRAALEKSYEEYWLTREDGTRLPVLLLGPDGDSPARVRVTAPGLEPGQKVRVGTDS